MEQGATTTRTRPGARVPARRDRATRLAAREEEFTAYLAARRAALLRTAFLVTGDRNQAEDVLQTALAKLYLAWDRVDRSGSVDAYVRRIIVNEHASLWRRGWRRRENASETLPDSPHLDRYDEGEGDVLWQALLTLPPKARAVVVLRFYEQLSEAEAADVLGVSVGTVKSQTHRALGLLRERVPAHLHPTASSTDSTASPEEIR